MEKTAEGQDNHREGAREDILLRKERGISQTYRYWRLSFSTSCKRRNAQRYHKGGPSADQLRAFVLPVEGAVSYRDLVNH